MRINDTQTVFFQYLVHTNTLRIKSRYRSTKLQEITVYLEDFTGEANRIKNNCPEFIVLDGSESWVGFHCNFLLTVSYTRHQVDNGEVTLLFIDGDQITLHSLKDVDATQILQMVDERLPT